MMFRWCYYLFVLLRCLLRVLRASSPWMRDKVDKCGANGCVPLEAVGMQWCRRRPCLRSWWWWLRAWAARHRCVEGCDAGRRCQCVRESATLYSTPLEHRGQITLSHRRAITSTTSIQKKNRCKYVWNRNTLVLGTDIASIADTTNTAAVGLLVCNKLWVNDSGSGSGSGSASDTKTYNNNNNKNKKKKKKEAESENSESKSESKSKSKSDSQKCNHNNCSRDRESRNRNRNSNRAALVKVWAVVWGNGVQAPPPGAGAGGVWGWSARAAAPLTRCRTMWCVVLATVWLAASVVRAGVPPAPLHPRRGYPEIAAAAAAAASAASGPQDNTWTASKRDTPPSQLMLRPPRSSRQYDVPQIECPPAADGMERFACPTPDRQGRYHCIDDHVLCDGFIDCPSGEDEDRQACMFYKTTKAHLDVLADALLRWARGR